MADADIQGWLASHLADVPQVAAAIVLRWGTDAAPWQAALWPADAPVAKPLFAAAKEAAQRSEPVLAFLRSRAAAIEKRVVALALRQNGVAVGALALMLHEGSVPDAEGLDHARRALALLEPLFVAERDLTTELLKLQTSLTQPGSLAQCGARLVSEAAVRLGADRVSLGLLERGAMRLTALSHRADVGERGTTLAHALPEAMQEAVDQGHTIAFPQPAGSQPRIVVAHTALARLGPGHVLTVPLVCDGRAIGALCFEGSAASACTAWRDAAALASALAPLVELKRRAERAWHVRAAEGLRGALGRSRRARAGTLALGAGGAIALLALLTMVPVTHRVGAPARLEGSVQRSVVAPMDGFIQAVRVRPGDPAKAGDLLVEMAPQDLALEERKWEAEATQHENAAASALALADRAQFAVAHAKAAEARAQLDLVRQQLQRSRLTAPIDGVVIGGDLTQSLGAPVQRGQVLMTLAPRDDYRLILDVDERDVSELRLGQRGQLALGALPSRRIDFQVLRITPVAVAAEGRNSFEVEARLDEVLPAMRPGLRGVAKIETGTRSLLGIVTRPVVDWLRLAFWRWS
ncbi:MAG TPA: HlyD family efflux transporter periplasmic adaptor subunit, partial [Burkholderiaceae bacterium]|nr:HlyD family efflux transporter periplasmic adaptor subunit [Burkholderiaceae bacterium]